MPSMGQIFESEKQRDKLVRTLAALHAGSDEHSAAVMRLRLLEAKLAKFPPPRLK